MKTSTTTGRLAIYENGVDAAIRTIAKAGFDCFDYSVFGYNPENPVFQDGWEDYIAGLKKTAPDAGIECNQCHAPFPSRKPAEDPASEYNSTIIDHIIRVIRASAMLGSKQIIIHPISAFPFTEHEQYWKDVNMDLYRSLAPYAKEAGTRIAIENMFVYDGPRKMLVPSACGDPREMADYFDTLADDVFTCCLDIGHAALSGFDPAGYIRILGKERLGALHTHDNSLVNDDHMPPFTGKIDWASVAKALGEIDYQGDLTLESDSLLNKCGNDPALWQPAFAFMSAAARRLANDVDAARPQ